MKHNNIKCTEAKKKTCCWLLEIQHFTAVREVHNNQQSHNLIGLYDTLEISTQFTKPFLAGRCTWSGHETTANLQHYKLAFIALFRLKLEHDYMGHLIEKGSLGWFLEMCTFMHQIILYLNWVHLMHPQEIDCSNCLGKHIHFLALFALVSSIALSKLGIRTFGWSPSFKSQCQDPINLHSQCPHRNLCHDGS